MMRAVPLLILFTVCCLLCGLVSCGDGPSEPSTASHIRGLVVDDQGQPVEGAGILMSYRPSFVDILVDQRATRDLPDPVPVEIVITRFCSGDTVRVIDGREGAGVYWNGLNRDGERVVEGIYVATVADSTGTVLVTREMVLLQVWYDDASTQDAREFFAHTDSEGRFDFSQECLPFGHMVTTTGEGGDVIDTRTITQWVDLWAVTDVAGVCAHVDSVKVHEWGGVDVRLEIPPVAP